MVSAVHQCESITGIPVSPPSRTSLPPPVPPSGLVVTGHPKLVLSDNFLFYTKVWPINSIAKVSGRQQRDSAMHIQVSILSQTPLPSRMAHP